MRPWFLLAIATTSLVVDSACLNVEASEDYTGASKKKKGTSSGTNEDDPADTTDKNDPSTSSSGTNARADAGATVRDNGTHGTGGPNGAGGNTELTSASGLRFRIDAANTGDKPHGLLVLLHGSSASNYTNMVGMMSAVAQTYDLIRVSVLAPNGQGWNEGDQPGAAEKLHQLVQQDLFAKYNIDKTRVMFSGQSSGAGFLASHFIALHAADYRGGAFLQCGANAPFNNFTPDDATKAGFKMHFEITSADPIWPQQYAAGTAKYASLGMQLTKDNSKPGGHCAFDQQAVIQAHIGFVLGTP